MKKKIEVLAKTIFWMIIYLAFVLIGVIIGMLYQQLIFIKGATHILSYSDIEVNVNFNETKFLEELNNTFVPAWKEEFNQTFYSQLNLTTQNKT